MPNLESWKKSIDLIGRLENLDSTHLGSSSSSILLSVLVAPSWDFLFFKKQLLRPNMLDRSFSCLSPSFPLRDGLDLVPKKMSFVKEALQEDKTHSHSVDRVDMARIRIHSNEFSRASPGGRNSHPVNLSFPHLI